MSYTAIPLDLCFNETEKKLASGTGFIYEIEDKFYLITNWHNVTGLRPDNKEQLGDMGGRPDLINFNLLVQKKPIIKWKAFSIPLYEDEKAEWYIHPEHGEKVDVVAIPLTVPDNFDGILRPINKIHFDDFKLEVADDVFILGFPYKFKGGGQFPIWKKGSVATEPDLDLEGLPKFYVDTASKSGMSGSPVIFRRVGIHGAAKGELSIDSIFGEIRGFVGIYSGRILGKSNLDAQLGVIWKKEVIDQIIKGQIKDTHGMY